MLRKLFSGSAIKAYDPISSQISLNSSNICSNSCIRFNSIQLKSNIFNVFLCAKYKVFSPSFIINETKFSENESICALLNIVAKNRLFQLRHVEFS